MKVSVLPFMVAASSIATAAPAPTTTPTNDATVALAAAGEPVTLHDTTHLTTVRLMFGAACSRGGNVRVTSSAMKPHPPDVSFVIESESASALIEPAQLERSRDQYSYQSNCGRAVAAGRISIVVDAADRPLPPRTQAPVTIADDRDRHTIVYAGTVPAITVTTTLRQSRYVLHVRRNRDEHTIVATTPSITIPEAWLRWGVPDGEGDFVYWFETNDRAVKDRSYLTLSPDPKAAQLHFDRSSWEAGRELTLAGTAMPGWTLSAEGVAIPVDDKGSFHAQLAASTERVRLLRAVHPQRGIHYYVLRAR